MYQNTAQILAIEPDVNMDQTNSDGPFAPVSTNFSFVTVELDDEINNALQQRTFTIIRTGPETGYYLDIFGLNQKTAIITMIIYTIITVSVSRLLQIMKK